MKTKYQRLTKEEKKEAIAKYNEDESNKAFYKRLKRIRIVSIIGIVYALLSFVLDTIMKQGVWSFCIDSVLLIFCIVFLLKSHDILVKSINNFLIKNTKKSKK